MSLSEQDVLAALRKVRYPGFTRDIVSFGIVKGLEVRDGAVRVRLDLGAGNPAAAAALEKDARAALEALPGVRSVEMFMIARSYKLSYRWAAALNTE